MRTAPYNFNSRITIIFIFFASFSAFFGITLQPNLLNGHKFHYLFFFSFSCPVFLLKHIIGTLRSWYFKWSQPYGHMMGQLLKSEIVSAHFSVNTFFFTRHDVNFIHNGTSCKKKKKWCTRHSSEKTKVRFYTSQHILFGRAIFFFLSLHTSWNSFQYW